MVARIQDAGGWWCAVRGKVMILVKDQEGCQAAEEAGKDNLKKLGMMEKE